MSAPKTNVEEQEKRHRIPLMGMGWTVVWAIGLLIALIIFFAVTGNDPADGEPAEAGSSEAASSAEEGTGG